MRIPFFSLFSTSPFDALQEHAEKVKECSWAFQQAMECWASDRRDSFEEFRQEVVRFELEADAIKQRIRDHLPRDVALPVEKFHLFRYLREQDKALDSVLHALNWLSYRSDANIPKSIEKELFLLVDAVVESIEELAVMVTEARIYFKKFSKNQRRKVKESVRNLRKMKNEADQKEHLLIGKIYQVEKDPVALFHLVRVAQTIREIADHAENTADMMRAMLAK